MLPDPLHPAVVHLPIALAVLMPLLGILSILSIWKNFLPPRSWATWVLLQALLTGSASLALETGEDQQERVEQVVASRHIHEHEEAAERFLVLAGLGLVLGGVGLLPRRAGHFGRLAATLASCAVLAAGVSVGHSGGGLVYEYGAANAYLPGAGGPRQPGD